MREIRAVFQAIFCLAMCAVLLSCHSSRHSQAAPRAGNRSDLLTRVQPFAPGRQVDLNINVADVRIQPAADDHELRLVIRPKHPVSSGRMHSWIRQLDVTDRGAEILLQLPKLASAEVELDVPSSTALNIRLGIGNLDIDRITGDKNVAINVGNLTLSGLNRDDYGRTRLRADIGNLSDGIFPGHIYGMIGKSENVTGPGKFDIRAHVGTGNIDLRKGSARGTD